MMEQIKVDLEKLALQVVTLEPGDIPAMGEMLNAFSALEEKAERLEDQTFLNITHSQKVYLEKIILAETGDMGPLEDGITTLQTIWRAINNNETYSFDTTHILKRLGFFQNEEAGKSAPNQTERAIQQPAKDEWTQEDIQILKDFVIEALENLEQIEIHLINLEQDPDDQETINAIFRPFHTIKGVSGFLNLNHINRLAHSTENLLDSARQGECRITNAVIDIVLESVDTLKQLIHGVEKALASGEKELEKNSDIEPLINKIEATIRHADKAGKRLGEILVGKGTLKEEELNQVLKKQETMPDKKIGEILIEKKKAKPKEVISALRDQKGNQRLLERQVKVDTAKLDNLVDLTGELVISQAMLRQNNLIKSLNDQQLYQNLNQLTQIVSGLQKIAMSMRMVPIKSTFHKMVRLVRDLARNSGKEVGLEMVGEDTEIDRNVVEELYEPLVHMIRNAVDHGIELPQERLKAEKEAKGIIRLRAYHKGGNIVIEIEDDGRGLNKERILEKAIAIHLISKDAKLSEAEIYDLIFHPGFSTAAKITAVSGRGVGMDVVKKGIEKLRGRLDIRSAPGQGSTVVISLPLTLAIIEGMIVRVGTQRYILPTMAILESFKPRKHDYYTIKGKGEMVMVRGDLTPLIRLDRMFGVQGDSKNPWDGLVVVVENKNEKRGLLLDELLGQEEVVIKSLGEALKNIKGMAGGAILGDGKVGLILDIAGLFEILQKNY
ncbi:MAG: chemotaxis protein CheA [Desulfobacterales bacterium]|nr:chemotaxis protein CheA [Desulfobacterales bacterium]